jgi:beta-glucosidase
MTRFPQSFLWGAANAAYQVEGAASEDGRGPSIWDTFSHTPGAVVRGDTGDIACDQYHRLDSDLDLMAEMGLKLHRFSASWSRVVPSGQGTVNEKGLDYYERMVDGLLRRGIQPMLTIYHWDLPQALQDKGGWTVRDTASHYADYAAILNRRLGDRVAYWNTLNEPWCVAFVGHRDGVHAPGLRDEVAALKVVHHQLLAHGLGIERMRADGTRGKIGPALNLVSEIPASQKPEDVAAARRLDGIENRILLDPLFKGEYPKDVIEHYSAASDFGFARPEDFALISQPLDFLGVNYYEQHVTRADPTDPSRKAVFEYPGKRRTAMNIGVNPSGLRDMLVRVTREYGSLPIIITENGIATTDYVDPDGQIKDRERIEYWDEHLDAIRQAIGQGVDVRGYVAWSFLDNYEWNVGYSRRYGMIFVDYGTQRRLWKASGRWYRDVIATNGSTIGANSSVRVDPAAELAVVEPAPWNLRRADEY